jgi:hypothetical protein
MVKPFENKAFDLLKSDVHAAKIGLGPSKNLALSFVQYTNWYKKAGQQSLKLLPRSLGAFCLTPP